MAAKAYVYVMSIQAHDDSQSAPEVKEKSDHVQRPIASSKSKGIVIYG